ncbi:MULTISPECIES: TylF/MycF/NovP-related O-methyltransferase [unclassified Ruegeria]|uniref:TylF/MycF/NovP-related O-methyltransferase n=1 Tax=unclassified Ruegeria TaxID=2625375 RepID=UPI0014885942|nr:MULTISPECIES: TylF/MycF/NovP-related O-methyltransferase [unclassified Ruegeria]NOD62922.1 macrocin O-methyltransferase [Ruegeria sp. HKCCD6109]
MEGSELARPEIRTVRRVCREHLTMVGRQSAFATAHAAAHVVDQKIPGDFVECGVWRGGNVIIAARVFMQRNDVRTCHLFDTFAGMTEPTAEDIGPNGEAAIVEFERQKTEEGSTWCMASLEDVQSNVTAFDLNPDMFVYRKGDVLETLKDEANLPETISVLRLDTDWHESTKLELETLYARLSPGGIVIIDDYGHWKGARKATDEFFKTSGFKRPFFFGLSNGGVIGTKI